MLFQIHKVTMDQDYAVAKLCEPFPTGCNRHRIAVKPDKPAVSTTRIKKLFSMPTVPHRTIKIGSSILSNDPKQDFFGHDWEMSRDLHKPLKTRLTHFLPPKPRSIHPLKDLSIENSWTYED